MPMAVANGGEGKRQVQSGREWLLDQHWGRTTGQ